MDGPSSSTAKRPKASSSRDSNEDTPVVSHPSHDGETQSPRPPPAMTGGGRVAGRGRRRQLHVSMLPLAAHNMIASFLTNHDLMRVMEAGSWSCRVYGGRVRDLILSSSSIDHESTTRSMMDSILARRPGLVGLQVAGVEAMAALAHALTLQHDHGSSGNGGSLRVLNIWDVSSPDKNPYREPLLAALGKGACPRLVCLRLSLNHYDADEVVGALGEALRARASQGQGGGLRVLVLESAEPVVGQGSEKAGAKSDAELEDYVTLHHLSPVLSSGGCEGLEELLLGKCYLHGHASEDLAGWLTTTRAPHLKAMTVALTPAVAAALATPGVAPQLQVLGLTNPRPDDYDQQALFTFMTTMLGGGQGSWPDLKELQVEMDGVEMGKLMEVLMVGAQGLRSLTVKSKDGRPDCLVALGHGLGKGACPRLEKLHVTTAMDDEGLIALAQALGGKAPCSYNLRSLSLEACDFGPEGIKFLSGVLAQGGVCAKLEALNLSYNELGDESVVYLAECMERGGLPRLLVLNLQNVSVEDAGARALSRALRHRGTCPHLEFVCLSQNCISPAAGKELEETLRARGGSCIVEMDVEEEEEDGDDDAD